MSRADHLLYTSRRGGFQIVEATGLLADEHSPVADEARRLCRYIRPRGLDDPARCPVSFGWTSVGATRLVFRRGYLGEDGTRRRGNFYAHVVAGPLEELPISRIAPQVSADWWWQGEDLREYGELPAWPFTDLPPLTRMTADHFHPFVDAVFHARSRTPVVLVGRRPEQTVAMAAEIAEFVGEPFERVSLSTYESAEHADEFDIAGVADAQAVPAGAVDPDAGGASRSARRCRELVLMGDDSGRKILNLATTVAMEEQERRRFALLARCLPVFDRVTRKEPVKEDLVPPILRRGSAAEALLSYEAGVESVARALARGHEASWRALGKAVDEITARRRDALATCLGGELATRLSSEHVERLVAVPRHFAVRTVAAFIDAMRPGAVDELDWDHRRELLRLAPPELPPESSLRSLLRGSAEDGLAVTDAAELPVPWRGSALSAYVDSLDMRRQRTLRPVVKRMLEEPELAAATARALTSTDFFDAVAEGQPTDEAFWVLVGAADGLTGEKILSPLRRLLDRYSRGSRLHVLVQVAERVPGELPERPWDRLVTDVLLDGLDTAGNGLSYGREAVPLLARTGGARSEIWLLVLHGVRTELEAGRGLHEDGIRKALAHIDALPDSAGHRQARELLLAQYLAWQPTLERTGRVADAVTRACGYPHDDTALLLLGLPIPAKSRNFVVLHVARLVADGTLPVTRLRKGLCNKRLQKAVEATLKEGDPRDAQAVISYARRYIGGALPWLYRI
jgi:hypothetical protein